MSKSILIIKKKNGQLDTIQFYNQIPIPTLFEALQQLTKPHSAPSKRAIKKYILETTADEHVIWEERLLQHEAEMVLLGEANFTHSFYWEGKWFLEKLK